jgi:25S rRNA (cytosine2870-C5)-methyltransferase
MCPVLALQPQPNEHILDFSAAPGGKTSYVAQLMHNTGVIIANDLKSERQKAAVANLPRLGVKNVITCAYDGRKFGSNSNSNKNENHNMRNLFDRILLDDAPCSGLCFISRDRSVKVQRTMKDIQQCAQLQKELLFAAIDSLKYKNTTGGCMVYSMCSISIHENEEVVQYSLGKRDIQIIRSGLDFGSNGFTRYQNKRFHPSLALCKHCYPHTVNMDGFFVCKIKKSIDKQFNNDDNNNKISYVSNETIVVDDGATMEIDPDTKIIPDVNEEDRMVESPSVFYMTVIGNAVQGVKNRSRQQTIK